MTHRRVIIAGTASGTGKTTLTLGLMAAFMQEGRIVQGFKCGPDYIDPSYHTAITGRPSRNLDSWMLDRTALNETLEKGSRGADISVVEGVMGLYDGKNPLSDQGSTADISMITKTPVILVVDCSASARSAAAVIHGFQSFNQNVNIAGVIANKVGSAKHYELVKFAVDQMCGIPMAGYVLNHSDMKMPERHLGLIPSIEQGGLPAFFQKMGEYISGTVDLARIYELAAAAESPDFIEAPLKSLPDKNVTIAVAKDAAFNFYYPENLELLEENGAELVYFSPLAGERVPSGVHGLYLGGGFPEVYAEELAAQGTARMSVRQAVECGMPTVAECGGLMYLCDTLQTSDGKEHAMAGVIRGKTEMKEKLQAIGYREASGSADNFLLAVDEQLRGHEFHYSVFHSDAPHLPAYHMMASSADTDEGVLQHNVTAGYTHFHFLSNQRAAYNWIQACEKWKING